MFSVPILYSRLAKNPAEKQLTTRALSLLLVDEDLFGFKILQKAGYCEGHGLIKKYNQAKRFTVIFKHKKSAKPSNGPHQLIPFGRGDPDLSHALDRGSCNCAYGKNFIEPMLLNKRVDACIRVKCLEGR